MLALWLIFIVVHKRQIQPPNVFFRNSTQINNVDRALKVGRHIEVNQLTQSRGLSWGNENMRHPAVRVHSRGEFRVGISPRVKVTNVPVTNYWNSSSD